MMNKKNKCVFMRDLFKKNRFKSGIDQIPQLYLEM